MKNLDIIIGGPQGTGLEVSMRILSRLFTGYGFKVLANREYHSNIRGKHSYIHIKVSTDKVRGLKYPVDLIASIDAESIFHHFIDIKPNGLFIYNKDDEPLKLREMKFLEEVTARRIKEKLRELGISDDLFIKLLSEFIMRNRSRVILTHGGSFRIKLDNVYVGLVKVIV